MKKLGVVIVLVAFGALMPAAVEAGVRFARFAKNAGKVDGFNAVGSGTSVENRDDRLVATNALGHLPNNIIEKAPDSALLGGFPESHFVHECERGAISSVAEVPADVPAEWTRVGGYGGIRYLGQQGSPDFCDDIMTGIRARRVGEGVYEVTATPMDDVAGVERGCFRGEERTVPAIVTVQDQRPLIATYESFSCVGETRNGYEVRIFDLDGSPTDAAFTFAELEAAIIQFNG